MTQTSNPARASRLAAVVLLLLALPVHVLAQATAGRTVVVSLTDHESTTKEQRVADQVEAALSARGIPIVSMHDARDRIQAQSRPPMSPDSSDLDLLAREARAAIEHVAFGRSAAAQRSVQEVFKRAERALESLNRETTTARNVLDACLALVRNTLVAGNRENALEDAMRCRRLVPDVAPSEFLHPAAVVGVLAEADNQLRRMRIGQLVVESKPESGCATYVNGRHLGMTPFRLDRAAEGEYRVQVECGRAPGRVHLVHLGEKPVELTVDIELDRAVHSDGRVALVYDNAHQAKRLALPHGVEVGRSVRAEEAVLVSVIGKYAVLSRVSVARATLLGRSRLPWSSGLDPASPELGRALDALLEGRIEEGSDTLVVDASPQPMQAGKGQPGEEQVPQQSLTAEATRPAAKSQPQKRLRRMRGAAIGVGAAGAGLFFAGVAFEHQRARADDKLAGLAISEDDAAIASVQDDYDRGKSLRWLGLGGGLLLGAAVPLLRVDVSNGVPWWSYVLGAAGAGLATWGAVELVKDGNCEDSLASGGCGDRRESTGKGALLLAGAFPLLLFPIDHLIEWRLHRDRSMKPALALAAHGSVLLTVRMALPGL